MGCNYYLRCSYCKEKITGKEAYCPNCGVPITGKVIEKVFLEEEEPVIIREKPEKPREKPAEKPVKSTMRRATPADFAALRNQREPRHWKLPWKKIKLVVLVLLLFFLVRNFKMSYFEDLSHWISDTSLYFSQRGEYQDLMDHLPFTYLNSELPTESRESYAKQVSAEEYVFLEFGYEDDHLSVFRETRYVNCTEDQEEQVMQRIREESGAWGEQSETAFQRERMGRYLKITRDLRGLTDSLVMLDAQMHHLLPVYMDGENTKITSSQVSRQLLRRDWCKK